MGCGASKKGQEELLPKKKDTTTTAGPENNEQNNQQQTDEDLPEDQQADATRDKTAKGKKKKGKKSNKVGAEDPDNPAEREPGDPFDVERLRTQGLGRKSGMGDLSNLNDLPEYDPGNPNFKFRDGELSPIGMNNSRMEKGADPRRRTVAQGASQNMTSSFEREIVARFSDHSDKNKVGLQPPQQQIRVRRPKTSVFNWPDKGQVEIKSVNYKVVYSHELRGFRTIKSKDSYLTSLLSWYKDEDEDLYEFSIKDEAATELRSGNSTLLNTPQINFQVDRDGKFVNFVKSKKLLTCYSWELKMRRSL